MKQEFSSAFFEKDQHLADKPYIFYEDEERRSKEPEASGSNRLVDGECQLQEDQEGDESKRIWGVDPVGSASWNILGHGSFLANG